MNEALLIAHVTEVRGVKVKAKMLHGKNEPHIFFRGELIKNVSVGSYVKIPCGFDLVIGTIDGEIQQERSRFGETADGRVSGTVDYDRYLEVSVFGVLSEGRFKRGLSVLPLMGSKVYVLEPDELRLISASDTGDKGSFAIGSLAGNDDVEVTVSANSLFASHIGIFGNTGSGKSNTLCKLYTDCFEGMERSGALASGKSRFIFVDFNGEYVDDKVLTGSKSVYKLSTRSASSGDKLPVPEDFYFDCTIWAVLTSATEKTQKPFLSKVHRLAEKIKNASNPESYTLKIVDNTLQDCAAKPVLFNDQRSDLVAALSYLVDKDKLPESVESIEEQLEDVEVFTGMGNPVLRIGSTYCNTPSDVPSFFNGVTSLLTGFSALFGDIPAFMSFCAHLLYFQKCLSGSIVRESISWWLPRYKQQLLASSKIYEVSKPGTVPKVMVVSLLDVNQEQKKTIPLVVAKYAYESQKRENTSSRESSTHLIVDEAHNILSYSSMRESENWRDYRLETFEEIIKEGRKFGMYLTLASQRPSDISPTIISQLHNYFIHRLVNEEDLRAIAKAVSFIDSASFSMIPVQPQGGCVVSGTAIPHPIRIQVPPLPSAQRPSSGDRNLLSSWGISSFSVASAE